MKERDLKLVVNCMYCGKSFEIMVNGDDYRSWRNGEGLIQNKLPYLTASERELIMNQICNDCWDEAMIDWDYYKPLFMAYYETQMEGKYNMIQDAEKVIKKLNMDIDDYKFIQEKYTVMLKHFKHDPEIKEIDHKLMNKFN